MCRDMGLGVSPVISCYSTSKLRQLHGPPVVSNRVQGMVSPHILLSECVCTQHALALHFRSCARFLADGKVIQCVHPHGLNKINMGCL